MAPAVTFPLSGVRRQPEMKRRSLLGGGGINHSPVDVRTDTHEHWTANLMITFVCCQMAFDSFPPLSSCCRCCCTFASRGAPVIDAEAAACHDCRASLQKETPTASATWRVPAIAPAPVSGDLSLSLPSKLTHRRGRVHD